MSCPYCRREGPPEPSLAPGGARKTVGKTARKTGWLFPGILLVLMPKCPVCLAAYIALVTGISIPIAAAT